MTIEYCLLCGTELKELVEWDGNIPDSVKRAGACPTHGDIIVSCEEFVSGSLDRSTHMTAGSQEFAVMSESSGQ